MQQLRYGPIRSDKTKTLVETAIYRVSKTHDFVQVALNPSVLRYSHFESGEVQVCK